MAAAPAWAQARDFRQTVVTAAARPVDLGSVTRLMTVITREQIARLPVQSVADVLRLASSIDVRMRGVGGVQSDFAVRVANFGQMLVLVDRVRLNDAQSGHHNGDIPVPLDAVERIEVLYGPGSSLFGADAFGGTVNVVTRRSVDRPSLVVEGGSFETATGRGEIGFERGAVREALAVSTDRSSGFMYERDSKATIVRSRTSLGARTSLSFSHLWKAFGANNFYGGNAPSREWTNQTLVTRRSSVSRGGWRRAGHTQVLRRRFDGARGVHRARHRCGGRDSVVEVRARLGAAFVRCRGRDSLAGWDSRRPARRVSPPLTLDWHVRLRPARCADRPAPQPASRAVRRRSQSSGSELPGDRRRRDAGSDDVGVVISSAVERTL